MDLHKLLLRQLKHLGLDANNPPVSLEKWQKFLTRINNTYIEEDTERYLQDRSMLVVTSEINELNEKLYRLQKIGRIGYWYNNLTTGINIWSKGMSRMFGQPPGLQAPKMEKIYEMIHPEDLPLVKDSIDSAIIQNKEFEIEIRLRNVNGTGEYKWYQIIGQAQINKDNDEKVLVGIAMDVNTRKKNQEKIAKLNQHIIHSEKMSMIGQLSAGIAHEINNPLTYALNNLGVLNNRLILFTNLFETYNTLMTELNILQIEQLKSYCEKINSLQHEKNVSALILDSTNLITESIDGLLRIKEIVANIKIFSGFENPTMEDINLNDCILSAIDIVWHNTNIDCELIQELGELPVIKGSFNQLMLVFVNLLLNAKQAIGKNGIITVVSKCVKSIIIVSITDNGCGISPENIPKLFTPFFTTKPIGRGTGLGLASAYGIIHLHGGKISVISKPGYGAEFTIELPTVINRKDKNLYSDM